MYTKTQVNFMTFDKVLEALKEGKRVARAIWNREDEDTTTDFIYLVEASEFKVNRQPLNKLVPEGTTVKYGNHIDRITTIKDGPCRVAVWCITQLDVLAADWYIID